MVSITSDSDNRNNFTSSRVPSETTNSPAALATSQPKSSSQASTSRFQLEPAIQVQARAPASGTTANIDVSPICSTTQSVLEPLKISPTPLHSDPSSSTSSTLTTAAPTPSQSHSASSLPTLHSNGGSGRRASIWNKPRIYGKPSDLDKEQSHKMNINMRPSSLGSRKGKEVLEMASYPIAESSSVGDRRKQEDSDDKSKEDMAMAKWRKWVLEQPIDAPAHDGSPIRSRRASPASTMLTGPHAASSPRMSVFTHSPRVDLSSRQFSPAGSPLEPTGSAGSSASSPGGGRTSGFSPKASSMRLGSGSTTDAEVCNTESVIALRDVELAIDEEVLERSERLKHLNGSQARRMSTHPRISELPNPFSDIAQRLGSRRVRPIVLELIQALGHYLDAVWCITYPHRPCPWVIGVDESPMPASVRRLTMAQNNVASGSVVTWKSPMVTAVQEGKKTGHVVEPPTMQDVNFWADEVTFAIRDVDEVVGIYKGVGWAFGSAMRDGVYGTVTSDNVLGVKGEGGGMARLLNDLEEAIWGDAQPRPTDLSYDLPIDFDPYAVPDDQELLIAASIPRGGQSRSALTDFFGETRIIRKQGAGAGPAPGAGASTGGVPIMEEEIDALPDLINNSEDQELDADNNSEIDNKSDTIKSPTLSRGRSTMTIPGMNDLPTTAGEELTLEELGKRRHREWLENQRLGIDSW